MKLFLSWSGEASLRVATILKEWIPSVIQNIEPYVSSEDIDKGSRWSTDIAKELDSSAFGLLCVTRDNITAPWLNFEAGALGKSVDKSRVCPFLFGLKRSEVEGPILQFQSTVYEQDDVLKLLKSINKACDVGSINEHRLEKAFEVWWPNLKDALDAVFPTVEQDEQHKQEKVLNPGVDSILEEVLELSRNTQRLLRDPETLLPAPYLEHVFTRIHRAGPSGISNVAFRDIVSTYHEIRENIALRLASGENVIPLGEVDAMFSRIAKAVRYIESNVLRMRGAVKIGLDDESNDRCR